MKNDIILAGVGGQGILTIAAIVGNAAMSRSMNVKQSEVHGMAQRGGAVVAHLRLSSEPIFSDLIAAGKADVILGIEPMEALRHQHFLGDTGVLLANADPVKNIPDYPDTDDVIAALRRLPRVLVLEAGKMAAAAGSARAMNMVMLGALSPYLGLDEEDLTSTIRQAFAAKGANVVETNLAAFAAGREAAGRTW